MILKVKWHDAADKDGTWVTQEEAEQFGEGLIEIETLGYVVKRTKLYLTLAGDKANDGDYSRVCKIPIGMIQSEEELPSSA